MKYIKMFFRRIAKDFQHKELLPLKLLFFIHASTIFVLYPYLTIHMRELGISVEETAIMSAVTPVVAIVMPPLAGMIADKIGNFRVILAFFSAAGGAAALLLLLVPVGRITITYPDEVIFDLACNPGSQLGLSLSQDHPCKALHPYSYRTQVELETCGFVCHAVINADDSNALLSTRSYGVQLHKVNENITDTFNYTLKSADRQQMSVIDVETRSNKVLKNNEHYETAVRKLSKNAYFFPTSGLYNFSCELKESLDTTNRKPKFVKDDQRFFCKFAGKDVLEQMVQAFKHNFTVGIMPKSKTKDDIREGRQLYGVDYVDNGKDSMHDTSCLAGFGQGGEHISINVPLRNDDNENSDVYKRLELGSCAPRCIATAPRKDVCSNPTKQVELDMQITFWSYLCVRVFVGMIGGTAFAMFEGAVIAILREHKADYGLQRIYASIGGMISSPLSGWMIDYASAGKGYTDFRPAFYLYAGLKIASGLLMLSMNLEFKTPAKNVVSDVIAVLKKVELIALFISCFILGTAWGYIESFLFWLIQDLGGSRSLMGITITVGGIAGIPLLVLSGPIIKRIGHANVIFIGFIFYGIRLLGYSLIYNPWYCLIFEAMESVTSSLAFTAAVTYAAKLSTTTTDTSIQGMLGGLYFGVGKGAGSLIGGYLMKAIGTRSTFQIFSGATTLAGVIYFLFNFFWMRKNPSEGTDITKKDPVTEKEIESPIGFVEIDLNKKKDKAMAITGSTNDDGKDNDKLGGAVTNLGYEDTETFAFDDKLHDSDEKIEDIENKKPDNKI